MMSPIVRGTVGPLCVLLVAASLFALLRGHDHPGGGFVGGLLIAGAVALYAVAFGPDRARARMRVGPGAVVALGLGCVTAAALAPLALGEPLLTAQWGPAVPVVGALSTVLLFDTGVYLVVWGTASSILLALAESDPGPDPAASADPAPTDRERA
ncbi:MnhB domain-containing protein [Haliangium sp.]|uniref:MnhB domain-containing protein n=1 Tax=Haliangium sp. TaxID=2663208 RepID=UPI003D0F9396